jgi:pentatricopeptide repeat protein
MLWRVGRGSRQSPHQLVLSLADLFGPSSLHSSPFYPSLSLTWLRSFALTRPSVRPVPVPRDYDDPLMADSLLPDPVPLTNYQSITPPIRDLLLKHLSSLGISNLPPAPSQSPSKGVMGILADHDLLRVFSDSRKVSRLAQHMICTPRPRRALLVLVAAHRYGCHLGKEVYESVARRLAEAREWRLMPALAHLQKRQLGRHTVRLLDWRIRALVEDSQFAHLDRALGWFEEGGLSPSRRTYHLLLSGHLRNRDIAKAMDVIQQMSKAGFAINSCTQATVISAYRTLGPDAVVQTHALNALEDANASTSTRILNALLQFSIDIQDTERVLSLIRHFDFGTFDVSRLSLGVCPVRREGENAALSELIYLSSWNHTSRHLLPDIATYTILLHYLALRGDLLSALGLLGQMGRSGLIPDSRFITALIRLYFVVGRPSAAIGVVSAVCAEVEGSQTVFGGLRFESEPQEELPLFGVLPKPTAEILNALAAGLLHLRGIDGLQACLRLMQMCQVKPDNYTKALLESHLINAEGFTMADVSRVSKEFPLNDHSLPHLAQSLASISHCQFRSAKRSGWNHTPRKQNLFQTRFPSLPARVSTTAQYFDPTAGIRPVLTHQIPHIRPTIQSLTERGILADHRMFALRIRHEAVTRGDMTTAKKIFQVMLDRGLHPNRYHYAALMEGYAATGELVAAEAVMNTAERGGVRPSCVMHTILIVGYARQKDPERAMRVLRRMVATGIRPDVPVIDAITSVFFAVGAYRVARHTLLSLWPSVAPLPRNFERASLKMLVFHFRNLHNGHASSKTLSDRERRILFRKLKELSRTWSLMKKSRTGSQQESVVYDEDHSSLRRES